jgi:AraC-like DNA-binding protein
LTQVDFDRLLVQFANETLPRVAHSTLPNRYNIAFLADSNQPAAKYCGREISSNAAVLGLPGSSRHIRSYAACRWATMSFTPDDLSAVGTALTGCDLRLGSTMRVVHPEPAHMACLLRLHTATRQLADSTPEILMRPEVSNALEQELFHAMVTCLVDDTRVDVSAAWRHHSAIIKRFEDYLAANCDLPLFLTQICSATRASERTLRSCCQEHLGMGPLKYLWLRRMHLARRALIRQDPVRATVTQIATQYGFWHLGRFAVSYQRLFGESPSVTLHRPDRPKASPKINS